jgi:hypothetical protein
VGLAPPLLISCNILERSSSSEERGSDIRSLFEIRGLFLDWCLADFIRLDYGLVSEGKLP